MTMHVNPLKLLGLLAPLIGLLLLPIEAAGQENQPAFNERPPSVVEFGVRQLWGDVYGRSDLPFVPGLRSSGLNTYRDIGNGVFLRNADATLENLLGTGNFLHVQTQSSLRKDQAYLVTFAHPGQYKFQFRWDETPHIFTNTAQTPYTESSPGVFTLPASFRTALASTPSSLSQLMAAISPLDVSVRRKTATATATLNPTVDWTVGLRFSREKEFGYRPIGTYNPGLELPEPIDYRTTGIEATNEYARERWQIRFGYLGSLFENKVNSLVFDNAFSTTAQGRLGLYPDNSAHNLNFAGAMDLNNSTRVMASIVPGWMRQNDAFLPFTINPGIPPPPLPAQSLNGSKQTLAMNYTFVNHPAERIELTARYRSYDYNNNTPTLLFPTYILLDSLPGDILPGSSRRMPRQNVPYGFNRKNVELAATWQFLPKNTLKVGYEFERYDRDYRDVRRSDENSLVISSDLNLNKLTLVRLSYRYSERSPNLYVQSIASYPLGVEYARTQLSDFRRFDEAARHRNQGQASLQFNPFDRLSLEASYGTTQNNFKQSLYGLLSDISSYYTFDADYALRSDISVFGEYAREKYKTAQRSRLFCVDGADACSGINNSPNNDWQSFNRDLVDTWTTGLDVSKGRLRFNTYYSLSASSGSIYTWALGDNALPGFLLNNALSDCRFGGCTPVNFPNASNRLHTVGALIKFAVSKTVTPKLEYRYEQYDRVDWQTQFMRPSMASIDPDSLTQIYLGADAPSYKANILAFSVEYRF